MIVKLKRNILALLAAVIALSLTFNMSVYADEVDITENDYDTNKSAYLEYDESVGDYRLFNNDGTVFDLEQYNEEIILSNESDVDDSIVTTEPAVTTTIVTGVVYITTISTKAVSPAKTVPQYTGRTRSDALSEKSSYLHGYTTTTTTKATTKATTTKATTKAVYKGIDVSRHQGDIDWKKVKAAGIEFVMIRAGYGMEDDQVDLKFHENIKAAQAVGIDCGVYWYSYALNTSEALREAKLCYKTIKGYKLTYPVAFDIEDPSQSHLTMTEISNITKTFCNYLEEQKYFVSVYSYASMLTNKMNSSVLSKYDIWVAHTGVSKPNFSGKYGMWQYSWTGSVNGIKTDVDLDYSYKYYPDIVKKNKLNGF